MIEFFKKLETEIETHENIVIMGHQNPDLDCIGAAIGLYQTINKNCYIYKSQSTTNKATIRAYQQLKESKIKFIDNNNYKEILTKNTLLIIVDLNKPQLLENKTILQDVSDIILIDHHIIGKEKIKTKYEYIDNKASSTVEIITKYLKYKQIPIESIQATIMLAGIEIDTNGYNMKTSENTFESSAWLMKMGANNILKQNILKENKEEYIKRTKQIENSYMLNNIIICPLNEEIYNPSYLATMSEDLLRFENVEASFTIGKISKTKIGISARSLGTIDVEQYMSTLGGGGHLTDAACQLENKTIKEVEKILTQKLSTKEENK